MAAITVVAFLAAFVVGCFGSAETSTLLNVIQVYRHGERTPGEYYPNDPYKDISYWGISEGQLTNVGKRQHYELGQYTRQRYGDFLPLRYARENFLVQSTILDRTYMSAASQLSGLFPPTGDQVWNGFINWQPIPIFQTDPTVMSSTLTECAAYWPEFYRVIGSDPYFVRLNEEYAGLYEYLTNNSGYAVTNVWTSHTISDSLYIEERQNFSLPEWTKPVYPQPLRTLSNILFDSLSFNDKLKLITTGRFLAAVIEQFDAYLENPSSVRKYVQYSAHDANVAAILNTLGAFNPVLAPNFASTIYIEFRESNLSNFINIYYKNYGDAEPITIAGCDFDCEWNDFKGLVSNRTLTASGWEAICKI